MLLRTIWISNFADLIVVMTGGGPANTTQILPSYIFTTAYKKLDFGYASALSTALLLLLFLYAAMLIRLRRNLRSTGMSRGLPRRRWCSSRAIGCDPGLRAVRAVPAVLAGEDLVHAGPAALHRGHPRCGRRATTLANFDFVLLQSASSRTSSLNSVLVSRRHRRWRDAARRRRRLRASRASPSALKPAIAFLLLLTQMFPLVMLIAADLPADDAARA